MTYINKNLRGGWGTTHSEIESGRIIHAKLIFCTVATFLLATLAGPASAQNHSVDFIGFWASDGSTPTGSTLTIKEGEEAEFTIKGVLPSNIAGGELWVKFSCGGGTDCYRFFNTWPDWSKPSNPNENYKIPVTGSCVNRRDCWVTSGERREINYLFWVGTKDNNCRAPIRQMTVTAQVNRSDGRPSVSKEFMIRIMDDERDNLLKPEC